MAKDFYCVYKVFTLDGSMNYELWFDNYDDADYYVESCNEDRTSGDNYYYKFYKLSKDEFKYRKFYNPRLVFVSKITF